MNLHFIISRSILKLEDAKAFKDKLISRNSPAASIYEEPTVDTIVVLSKSHLFAKILEIDNDNKYDGGSLTLGTRHSGSRESLRAGPPVLL